MSDSIALTQDIATGVHLNVPAHEYHAWPFASASRLNTLRRSAQHLRHELDSPREQTDALLLGEAVHFAILQPDLFASRYVAAPKVDRRFKEGKAAWAEFVAANAGREVLDAGDHSLCMAMRDAVHAHPAASALIRRAADREVSAAWDCPQTGVRCKLRADGLCRDIATIIDIKTTRDASPGYFSRAMFTLGYHRQAAVYMHGLAALQQPFDDFAFIAVEKDPPHAVAVYRPDDASIDAGHQEAVALLEVYRRCFESGQWPGYSDHVQDVTLPRYAFDQLFSLEETQ